MQHQQKKGFRLIKPESLENLVPKGRVGKKMSIMLEIADFLKITGLAFWVVLYQKLVPEFTRKMGRDQVEILLVNHEKVPTTGLEPWSNHLAWPQHDPKAGWQV
jgi:hypothetical protein